MQHIGITLNNEKGETLKESNINFAEILNVVYDQEDCKTNFQWLSTIDPYGDTIFNPLQTPIIVNELNSLSVLLDKNLAEKVNNLVSFLKSINTHEYIKFIGD